MRGLAAVTISGIVVLGACTLTTDLDGYATHPKDGGATPVENGTSSGTSGLPDGGDVTTQNDGGTSGGPIVQCNVPTDADPHNCGACGRDCLGGTCAGGVCAAATLIKDVFKNPLGIGLSRGKLYVGDDNTLVEADLDGTHVKVVVTDVNVQYVAGTQDSVFFSDAKVDKVRRWDHPNDGSTTLVFGPVGALSGVAVTSTDLYYTSYADEAAGGGVYRVPLTGGDAAKLKGWSYPETVTVTDGKVYFAGDGEDLAVSLHDDGTTDEILEGGGATGIAVRGDDAFVTLQGAGQVFHVSLSTKRKEMVASGLKGPSGIVATPNAIYWAEVNSGNVGVLVR